MFDFPRGVYADVRIEDVLERGIQVTNGQVKENKKKQYIGAFIRVFDGNRWYYGSTTSIEGINKELKSLAEMATPNEAINEHPIVKQFEVNQEEIIQYAEKGLQTTSNEVVENFVWQYDEIAKQYEAIKYRSAIVLGRKVVKSFWSSKGACIKFDTQNMTGALIYSLNIGDKKMDSYFIHSGIHFEDLLGKEEELKADIEKSINFVENAEPVKGGKYPVVLAPIATGMFAHESFGHKSEADSMLGSEAMKAEWTIGKQVASSQLSIIDRGDYQGRAWVPFDDEGNRCHKTYLIKEGILCGRLHSASTAAALGEAPTGNARAMNFEYEPIVRMTCTYIDKGTMTKDELIAGIKEGIYVDTVIHGSGMSDFTLAPNRAYMIRDGKIAEPVKVSVVTGNVMKTLHLIDGISQDMQIEGGSCGKMEQMPLEVTMGGPYIRVKELDVQ